MIKCTSLMVLAAVVGFTPSISSLAIAQSKDALSIADNDSVYIDAKSFKIVPGKAGGDASALIKKLDARDLGPGEIIFRSGGKLYTVAAPPDQQRFGRDRYGSDRYGSDRRDYGSDQVVINDPEYAQYKLKKIFEDSWTAKDSK